MSKFKRAQQSLTFAHQWLLFDARHQDVFDAAGKVAACLRGQNKPIVSRPDQYAGDHVIVINTKEIAMPDGEWRWRMYYHHSLYAKGRTWASAYELHLRDPTIVMYKAIYKAIGNIDLPRKTLMARCHLFPDGQVPPALMRNVCDQIQQVQQIPKRLDDYEPELVRQYPKIVDLPDDYTVNKQQTGLL